MIAKNLTLITTTYNDAGNLCAYLDNISLQTLKPYKLIIIDGGSKDNIVEIVEGVKERYPFSIDFKYGSRLNIAQAFNEGVKHTTTEYLIITCLGNSFSSNMIELLFEKIIETRSDASYGILVGKESTYFSKIYNKAFVGGKYGVPIMSNRCVLYRRDVFERIGHFCENFIYAGEDSEYLNRFNKSGLTSSLVNFPVVFWETPTDMKEYMKKEKFYIIAKLQWFNSRWNLFFNVRFLYGYSLMLLFILFILIPGIWYLLSGMICLGYFFIGLKKKTASLLVYLLCLYQTYIDVYYSFSNLKYRRGIYRAKH